MDNYDTVVDPERPLAHRTLEVAQTLEVDTESGEIASFMPARLTFTEDGLVRPVAPFLEVWALSEGGELEPLTAQLLEAEGASPSEVRWSVRAGNLKVYRRTRDLNDRVLADTDEFTDHARHVLEGRCEHFWPGKTVPLGHIQYIRPTPAHPEIRVRFTPAPGHVYGSSETAPDEPRPNDPNIVDAVYDAERGSWLGHVDDGPGVTEPGNIYAGRGVSNEGWVSRGYLDDGCDGIVRVEISAGDRRLSAFARFGAGPPSYAPDSAPVRSVADELEQALLGPDVTGPDATPERVEEIVRRAFETVRLMNTAAMNAFGMGGHDARLGRRGDPIVAPSLADELALEHLHQSLLIALRSGTAPWFGDVLRDYNEVGDLTDRGRRKMPAMMRGSDGRHLALTRRQVNLIRALARGPIFADAP